eukprot:4453667-Prorocentrum_lima.AAC.1
MGRGDVLELDEPEVDPHAEFLLHREFSTTVTGYDEHLTDSVRLPAYLSRTQYDMEVILEWRIHR